MKMCDFGGSDDVSVSANMDCQVSMLREALRLSDLLER